MSKLQSAKTNIEKAHEIQASSTRFYREYNDQVRAELSRIRMDRLLSEDGRKEQTEAHKTKRGSELIRAAYERKKTYVAALEAAKKDAEAVIF
ncbi:hypothetical protein AB4Z21_18545, partial [Paenibacillus sp. MCAF20]